MAMLRIAKVVLQRGLTDQSELCVHCVGEYLHSKLCLMDSVKQKSATLRKRSKKLRQYLTNLEDRCRSAKLQAAASLKRSERLQLESAELDELLRQLPKAS